MGGEGRRWKERNEVGGEGAKERRGKEVVGEGGRGRRGSKRLLLNLNMIPHLCSPSSRLLIGVFKDPPADQYWRRVEVMDG